MLLTSSFLFILLFGQFLQRERGPWQSQVLLFGVVSVVTTWLHQRFWVEIIWFLRLQEEGKKNFQLPEIMGIIHFNCEWHFHRFSVVKCVLVLSLSAELTLCLEGRCQTRFSTVSCKKKRKKKKACEDYKIQLLILPPLILRRKLTFRDWNHKIRIQVINFYKKATCDSFIIRSTRLYIWAQGLTSYALKDWS